MDCSLCAIGIHTDDIANKVLFESDNYIVVPTIGPLSVGHAMIVSKKHYPSLALMDLDNIQEIKNIFEIVYNVYKTRDILFTEHGSFDNLKGGNCIVHTHVHILPGLSKYNTLLDDVLPKKTFADISEIKNIDYPYILTIANNVIVAYTAYNAYSQMMRKVISSVDNNYTSDWRTNRNEDFIKQTISIWGK